MHSNQETCDIVKAAVMKQLHVSEKSFMENILATEDN